MVRYIANRILWSLAAVFVVVVVNFVIVRSVPGDPVDALVGDYPAPQAYIDLLREQFGLNEPILVQLGIYLQQLASGNFGYSFANNQEVLPLLLGRAGNTLMLMVPGLVIASALGLLLGAYGAKRAGTLADSAITGASLVGFSMPVFWLGQLLMLLFAVNLGVLPPQGAGTPAHLVMPLFCISVFYLAVIARVSRSSIVSTYRQEYIRMAFARGVSGGRALWRHAVRSALGPIVTVIGFNFGSVLTGAVMTETVFGWPGLGSLFIQGINNRDYPVVQGVFLLAGIAVVVANLAVDVITALIDPRIKEASVTSRTVAKTRVVLP